MAESLPPLKLTELKKDLDNPNFSDYLYIGNEKDKGWSVAMFAHGVIPALRVFRIDPSVEAEVRKELKLDGTSLGIVFGWKPILREQLSKTVAENAMTVVKKIKAARAMPEP